MITIDGKQLDLDITGNIMSLQYDGVPVAQRIIGGAGDLESLIADAITHVKQMAAESASA